MRRWLLVLLLVLTGVAWAGPAAAADGGGTTAGITVLPAPSGSAPTPPAGEPGSGTPPESVTPPGAGSGPGLLPGTGVQIALQLTVVLALLTVGAALLLAGRRRARAAG